MTQQSFLDARLDVRTAVISPCGPYRYRLGRRWGDGPQMMWLMLNPSTADASIDDPTIVRCVNYARRWGFASMAVGNLFAFRATDPAGPDNDRHPIEMATEASLIVGDWGNGGSHLGRAAAVRRMIPGMRVLGLTKQGQPCHPLYLRGDLEPVEWEPIA